MKCGCEQGLDGRVKRLCEHHRRYFESETELLRDELGRVKAQNDILVGVIDINKTINELRAIVAVPRKRK